MTSETLQAGYTSYSLSGKAVEVDAPKATKTEIVFIDTGVGDYQALVDGFRPGVELVLVDDTQNGLTQMARALEGRSGVDAVHVIGHGAEGLLALGSARITLKNLGGYADAFATIRNALSPDADLLLYGCDVGKGEVGRAFVTALAQMSGADVAASDDPTGASSLGADGVLEVVNGSIEAAPAVMEAWNSYSATLAVSSYQAVNAPVPDFAPASPFGLYALGDFDGDGDQDMLRQTSVGGAGEFYENQNGTFVLSTRVQWPALGTLNLAQGKFADFDNDGDLDFYQQVGGADNDIYLQLPGSPPAIVATNLGGSGNPLSPGADIILTFSEAVFSGGGNIYIRDSATNAVIATVATNSSLVTGGAAAARSRSIQPRTSRREPTSILPSTRMHLSTRTA